MLKPSSCSSRFNTENMGAHERNNLHIKELGMSMGQAWGALKKSWKQYKFALATGDYKKIEGLKDRISYIREAMGLENEEIY